MCRDDVSSPFVEGSRLQRLRESIGPLFIRGHKYQADAPMVVFMPDVVHRVAEMFVARCYTWLKVISAHPPMCQIAAQFTCIDTHTPAVARFSAGSTYNALRPA